MPAGLGSASGPTSASAFTGLGTARQRLLRLHAQDGIPPPKQNHRLRRPLHLHIHRRLHLNPNRYRQLPLLRRILHLHLHLNLLHRQRRQGAARSRLVAQPHGLRFCPILPAASRLFAQSHDLDFDALDTSRTTSGSGSASAPLSPPPPASSSSSSSSRTRTTSAHDTVADTHPAYPTHSFDLLFRIAHHAHAQSLHFYLPSRPPRLRRPRLPRPRYH
ncbi:hypothetical protein B0H11DRAFT_49007 [Mycena galericulata]|nr:hypothetical protein B0H11DRAFT_49007 [Mycena galericulata]